MQIKLFRVGKTWHYRFQIHGTRKQRSTHSTDRVEADRIAMRAYIAFCDEQSARRGVVPALAQIVPMWIEAHRLTVSQSHVNSIERFGRLHIAGIKDVPIDQLSTAVVEEARNDHLQTHSQNTANHWTRNIRLLCHWAVRREIISAVPFQIRLLKVQQRPRTTLPADMSGEWLAALDDIAALPIRTAVRLMLGLGLRESEAATARWEWLDFARHTYTPGKTKGKEADPLPVPQWLMNYLRPLRTSVGTMIAKSNGHPYRRGFTRSAIAVTNAKIGITGVTPHRLRATLATLLSEHGAPVQSIQKMLRHKSVLTTMRYLEVDLHHVAVAQDRIAQQCGFDR